MRTVLLPRVQLIVQLAGATAAVAYCLAAGPQAFEKQWYLILLLVAARAVAEVLPVTVVKAGARLQYDAGGMVIVASAILFPTSVAAITIAVGVLIGTTIRREGLLHGLNNVSNLIVSAFIALTVAHLVGSGGLTPRSIFGGALAGILDDVCALTLLSLKVKLQGKRDFWKFFSSGIVATPTLAPWMISIGILIGAIGSTIPWALPLMAAPLALVFLASRSRVEALEDRARLDGLLGATTAILRAASVRAVTEAATTSAAALFEGQDGRIDTDEGGPGELSSILISERLGTQYLIVGARDSMMHRYTEQDRRLLETLASVAASALDKAALHEDVSAQATTDPLTGLPNRRSFEEQVRVTLAGMRSSDSAGIVFVDLDRFKQINDERGHQAGDEVLIETARRLTDAVRGGDTVARLGGDEFTILLAGVRNQEEAAMVADRVLKSMRRPIVLSSGAEVSTTPSIGIALALEPGADPTELLRDADAAMYRAKRAGKDCWRLAGEARQAAV